MLKSIRFKLFLTLLLTTVIVVAGMYAFMRWSLNRGFSEFVETRQQEHIESLVEGLGEYYAADPGWQKLRGDKRKWMELLWQSSGHGHRRPRFWIKEALTEGPAIWPPALPNKHGDRLFKPLELSVMLLDADQSIIFGRREKLDQLSLHPIRHQGRIAGYLGVIRGNPLLQLIEQQFIEKQVESFIWIALLMVVLSAGLALALAYVLGRPVKRITAAVKALAGGRYDTRLPVESGDELSQLALDFNDMAAAMEQSEHSRRRWIADISHELRTPISVLRGELEALQDGIRPLNRQAVESLYVDVMRLHRLTDDLYQLSMSDQGALSYHKIQVDPVAVLKDDLAALSSEFKNKRIAVHIIEKLSSPLIIHADPDRLSQLYRNLLKNTLAYTDPGGQLEISICRQADLLSFEFADSAPSVPETDIPHLFDRFYRVESSRSRNHGGAGLGLAICSNIVEAHNGTIEAYPSSLHGLAVRIDFPLVR